MVGCDPAGQEIVGEEGAGLLLLGYRVQVLPGGAAEPGRLDVHQHHVGIDRQERATVSMIPSITWSRIWT